MSFCRDWTLVKQIENVRRCKPLKCRSWRCDYCAPIRRNQLMAQAASGLPERFLTLTVNPSVGESPADRLKMLANSWRIVVKRLRRLHPTKPVEYLAVVEETKNGEPHLHILLRSPYIPQGWLSAAMSELMDSPIVDIRRIRSTNEVIRYVAKYITKAPAQFEGMKRYWSSQAWELRSKPTEEVPGLADTKWVIVRESILTLVERWAHEGYAARPDGGDRWLAIKTGYELTG